MLLPRMTFGAVAAILLTLAFSGVADAQGTVQQSGPVVPFHTSSWFSNGVIADAGGPPNPFLNGLGLFNGINCPFGISSQTGPGVSTSPYAIFSICQTNTTTTFNFQGSNGLGAPSVLFNIGGALFPFPSSTVVGGITVTPVISSGTISLSAFSQFVAVEKIIPSTTTIVLPAASSFPSCPSVANSCPLITVNDVLNNFSPSTPAIVVAADGKLVGGFTQFFESYPGQSQNFILVGSAWATD